MQKIVVFCVTRTRDPQLRRLLLYPLSYGANVAPKITKNSLSIQQHHRLARRLFGDISDSFSSGFFYDNGIALSVY